MNFYVSNLAYEVTDDDLREAFAKYGEVTSAKVARDNMGGASKGFGFVEMPNNSEADKAIKGINGTELMGQRVKVSEARDKNDKRGRRRRGRRR